MEPASPLLAEYNSNLDDLQRRLQATVPRASRPSTLRGGSGSVVAPTPIDRDEQLAIGVGGGDGGDGTGESGFGGGGGGGGGGDGGAGRGFGSAPGRVHGSDGNGDGDGEHVRVRYSSEPLTNPRPPLSQPSSPRLDSAIMQLTMVRTCNDMIWLRIMSIVSIHVVGCDKIYYSMCATFMIVIVT